MITRPPRPSSRTSLLVRGTGMVGAALAVGLTLAACGSGGATADPTPSETSRTTAPDDGGRASSAQRFPGASGEVAAVTGDIAQVQSSDSQTAVTWTASTVVTQQVAGSLADVTVGSCVSAFAARDDSSTATDDTAPVAAATVTVTAAGDDGTCAPRGGMAGRTGGGSADGGQVPEGFPTDRPSDLPSDMPSGFPGGGDGTGRQGFAAGVFGTVTAVSATGFTVEQTAFAAPGKDGTGQDDAAQPATTTRDVTVAADTTYTTTRTADASAIVVGQCMTAVGDEDSAGTITADTIALSPKGDDGCSQRAGAGRFGGGFPGGAGRSTQGDGTRADGTQGDGDA